MLPVAVARRFSGDNAVHYVFPVSWVTSCFHIMINEANTDIPIQAAGELFTVTRHAGGTRRKSAIVNCLVLNVMSIQIFSQRHVANGVAVGR